MRRTALAGLLTGLLGALGTLAIPTAAHADPVNSGMAFVWGNQPTAAEYDAPVLYSYNSTGGVNHIRRLGVGKYAVDMPNLGLSGGGSHASAYGSTTNACQVGYRTWGGGTMTVVVYCYAAGVLADTMFTASFTNHPTTSDTGFVSADQPESESYIPNPVFQFNSTGNLNKIVRSGVGQYLVIMPGLGLTGIGTVQVTAEGTYATRCSVSSWTGSGVWLPDGTPFPTRYVYVRCVNAIGVPRDSRFFMTSVSQTGFLSRVPASNARVDPHPPLDTGVPHTPISYYNSSGGAVTATRLAVGMYRVDMAGMPGTPNHVTVTALSFGGERCTVMFWGTGSAWVQCRDIAGAAYDSPFVIAYQGV